MIKIKNISTEEPFKIFEEKYNQALKLAMKNINIVHCKTPLKSFLSKCERHGLELTYF